jgi:two-component system response regulator HydG
VEALKEKTTVMEKQILVVEDEPGIREAMCKILQKEGYKVMSATNGEEGINTLQLHKNEIALVVTDLRMPKADGIELLRVAKTLAPDIKVILISGYATVETAVDAMKDGACDFIEKPSPDPGQSKIFKYIVLKTIKKALEDQYKDRRIAELESFKDAVASSGKVIGVSPPMRKVMDLVMQVASSSATILITGESGVGKEVIANAIHENSQRTDKPFIKVSCSAIPKNLLEGELFGYERGAFTGAVARREGRFELAHCGTLFLDEVGEITPSVQVKLLRVLQSGEFERLGSNKTFKGDIRLIAATNAILKEKVEKKQFREDLFYRLNVINIQIPPLRDRKEDIPLLAHHFLQLYCRKNDKKITDFSKEALDVLTNYAWPGNVRELENTVERAVVLTRGNQITIDVVPDEILSCAQKNPNIAIDERSINIPIGMPLKDIERRVMEATLRQSKGDKNIASKLLGISTRTIYRRLDEEEEDL